MARPYLIRQMDGVRPDLDQTSIYIINIWDKQSVYSVDSHYQAAH